MDTMEVESKIKDLENKIKELQNANNKKIDRFSSDDEKDGVREVVDEKLTDSAWNGYFYHSGITPVGTVTSAANAEDVERFRISAGAGTTLNVGRPSKMRTAFYFNNGTAGGANCVAYISTVHTRSTATPILDTDAEFVGFKIVNGTFFIMSYNRGESTLSETSFIADGETSYLCEIQYYPNERADFYIDTKYVGSISSNLPSTKSFTNTAYVFNTLHVSLQGTGGGTYNLVVDYYEFIQDRR